MCRLVGWVSDRPSTLLDVLGGQSLERLVRLSSFHADGWGIAYRSNGGVEIERSLRAARDDDAFARMSTDIATTAAIVHLRWATPGLGHSLADTHPFRCGDYAMAHNGAMDPVDRIDALLLPGASHRPRGTTDSERLLHGVTADLDAGAPDLVAALERTSTRAVRGGLHAASLNAMFLGPDGLHVLNWHDPARVPEAARRSNADDPSNPPYFDLRHRSQTGLDVVVSTGFTSGPFDLLPAASLTHIPGPGQASTRALRPELALCPLGN